MRVLVTGNLGYIGTVLAQRLIRMGHEVQGLDIGYFADCIVGDRPADPPTWNVDIRDVESKHLDGIDAVVHLAGLSNDPLGALNESLTDAINRDGTLRLLDVARNAGVGRFVYASSQSMYGVAATDAELDEDDSVKNPVTAYARTKWEAEIVIREASSPSFTTVAFRPSTVFGLSPRQRCDIVFNNFVARAFTSGEVLILSDGTPWRPVIHVQDVCSAFEAGLFADPEIVSGRAFNVGIKDGNYTVRDLADAAARSVPGARVVTAASPSTDERTYRVSFASILKELTPLYSPAWDLNKGGKELVDGWTKAGLTSEQAFGPTCIRLERLRELQDQGQLDGDLRVVR